MESEVRRLPPFEQGAKCKALSKPGFLGVGLPYPAPNPTTYSGTWAIPSGVNTFTVAPAGGFGFTPNKVTSLVIAAPGGGIVLTAVYDPNSVTGAGFNVILSGFTPAAGYTLIYTVST